MGAVVFSGAIKRDWMYSNGTFDVLFGHAYQFGDRRKLGDVLSGKVGDMSGQYIMEKWPSNGLDDFGSLRYLDLDQHSHDELLALAESLASGILRIGADTTRREPHRSELLRIGEELIGIVKSAAAAKREK